jgi:thymidylate kinase
MPPLGLTVVPDDWFTTRVVIEFIGVPGSGKSTLAQKLIAQLSAVDGYAQLKGVGFAALARRYPGVALQLLPFARSPVARRLAVLRLRYEHASRAEETYVFEECVTLSAWEGLCYHVPERLLQRMLPTNGIVIQVDVPPDVVQERIRSRTRLTGRKPMYLADADLSGPRWRRAIAAQERIVDIVATRRPVVRVDNCGEPDEITPQLAAHVVGLSAKDIRPAIYHLDIRSAM